MYIPYIFIYVATFCRYAKICFSKIGYISLTKLSG